MGRRQATPGQAASRERKLRCKAARIDRYAAEAHRRGIPVHQVPGILWQELQTSIRARREEARLARQRYEERWGSRRRGYFDW